MFSRELSGLKASFVAKALTPDVAICLQNSGFLGFKTGDRTFMDVFLYLGILFLICIPSVFFVKEKKVENRLIWEKGCIKNIDIEQLKYSLENAKK